MTQVGRARGTRAQGKMRRCEQPQACESPQARAVRRSPAIEGWRAACAASSPSVHVRRADTRARSPACGYRRGGGDTSARDFAVIAGFTHCEC
eukprot:scaffold1411_cov125-Isochrysis_galbana.AAC.15